MIKARFSTFEQSLIVEGKTTALIHGLLGFFKHLFADFKINREELSADEFLTWRDFFHRLMETCLEISNRCTYLLSNNRLTEEGENLVDSRGHPIAEK